MLRAGTVVRNPVVFTRDLFTRPVTVAMGLFMEYPLLFRTGWTVRMTHTVHKWGPVAPMDSGPVLFTDGDPVHRQTVEQCRTVAQ